MMRRTTSLLAAAVVASGVLGAAPASGAASARTPAHAACGNFETVQFRTYHVVMETDKKVYAIGDTATVHVKVTRPAHEDPLNNGIPIEPPASEAAADVNVGIGLRIGRVFLPGFGITDENGEVNVRIKLASYAPAGWATADGYAWQQVAQTTCATVEENGYKQEPRLFKVIK